MVTVLLLSNLNGSFNLMSFKYVPVEHEQVQQTVELQQLVDDRRYPTIFEGRLIFGGQSIFDQSTSFDQFFVAQVNFDQLFVAQVTAVR